MMRFHTSVLKSEVIGFLKPEYGKSFIDATAGGGGHTFELLERGARVLALDRDPDAISLLKSNAPKNLTIAEGNFSHIDKLAQENGFNLVDGIIFDLGVSSHQLDTPLRGFSFQKEGPLDMRMDPSLEIRASDIVNNFDKRRLNEIFKNLGQEKFSLAVADAICSTRQIKPIETTKDLAELVIEVYRKKRVRQKMHEATKIFQALRIVVNSELLNLEEALPQATRLLKKDGRLVVISFHSLEDRIVKRFLKNNSELKALTKLPIGPSNRELSSNPRSRSAKLRAAQKL